MHWLFVDHAEADVGCSANVDFPLNHWEMCDEKVATSVTASVAK
jgi:hypothetical protein